MIDDNNSDSSVPARRVFDIERRKQFREHFEIGEDGVFVWRKVATKKIRRVFVEPY